MNQELYNEIEEPQVLYDGRWVTRDNFRAFVYNSTDKKLANSYKEYRDLIESGLWFSNKEDAVPKPLISIKSRKTKNASTITDG